MANGHGGARTPAKPAPVSGPGKYSRRTDGGPAQVLSAAPNQDYGEAKQQLNEQRLAPMAGTQPTSAPAVQPGQAPDEGPQMPAFSGPGLLDPSQRPNEPTTTGVDIGPGAGSDALNLPPTQQQPGTGYITNMLRNLSPTDMSGQLATLYQAALTRGV